MKHGRSRGVEFQGLEKRLLFAAAPASPRAATLGATFDATERQTLLGRLTNLDSGTRASLQTKLNASVSQFDSALLSYMRSRSNVNFFFDPADTASIGQFIVNNHVSYTDIQAQANEVADSHLFPDQTNSTDFTVQLPTNINWVTPGGSTNPEFLHALNRHVWWEQLAWMSAISPNAKYASELEYELASWSQQYTTMDTPTAWSKSDRAGWLLDTSTRAETWTWAYFGFLDNAAFTGAENALFLYKFLQMGDFLYANSLTTTDFGSNRSIALSKGLVFIGDMFPEFDKATKWQSSARTLLFRSMDAQIYDDGSHIEQSPGYTFNVADDLLEARHLDVLNGSSWAKAYRDKLTNMIDSYWQMLSPDGTRPAIGDTYRTSSFGIFLKANLIQGTTRWPAAKPRTRDVWLLGDSTVTPYLSNAATPASLGTRGDSFPLKQSGNYILRSDDSSSARQIIFDAGPKGGVHGHYDLLNFELYGYGRPLISDPGAYKYDTSADRAYVVSTLAHNTINADGANVADIEGVNNPDITVSQFDTDVDSAQITATHRGYDYLDGSPVVSRSMWYDLDGTIIIVDWADGTSSHKWQESYNLQTEGDANNVTVDSANLIARTRYASGGNVKIQGITTSGETAVKGPLTFVTNQASGDYKDDAYRFTLNQTGSDVMFVTLISAYNGLTPPDTTATILSNSHGLLKVQLTKGGVAHEVDFTQPVLAHLDATASSRGTFNDIAFDSSNRLNLVYADRDTGALMYAMRDAKGNWSIPSVIDPAVSAVGAGAFQYVSLALDNNGNPGVAYFNGWDGDLRYAYRDPATHSWAVQTVDSKGSTGLYPSLAFSRNNGPVISFYNRTKGDLELAQSASGGFTITAIDSGGDVGRFSSLVLDPNRPTSTKWAIGYEDTTNGDYKYAIQGLFGGGTQVSGYTNYKVDDLAIAGGYVSLAFYDSGTSDTKRYKPAMSYYDAQNTALRYAKSLDSGLTWATQTVAEKKIQGLYTNLFFDSTGKANIFYFDRSDNEAIRAVLNKSGWTFTSLHAGGREIHTSMTAKGAIAYSTLDEDIAQLNVYII